MTNISELNPHNYPTTPILDKNLAILFERVMELQDCYGAPFRVTSGLRSDAQQAELIKQGKTNAKHSNHLIGCAVDILDTDEAIDDWIKENLNVLVKIGLWVEHSSKTINWCHLQCVPPKSGNRIFLP